MLFWPACGSAWLAAILTPLALSQGPWPVGSRAFTAGLLSAALVLRWARRVRLPAPAEAPSFWQSASAPARPPRSAPLPVPWLVTKKLIAGLASSAADGDAASKTRAAQWTNRIPLRLIFAFSRPINITCRSILLPTDQDQNPRQEGQKTHRPGRNSKARERRDGRDAGQDKPQRQEHHSERSQADSHSTPPFSFRHPLQCRSSDYNKKIRRSSGIIAWASS